MKIFITSGGTKVPIDEVRAITNNSKGTYAAAIASRFAERLHPKKDHLYFSYSKDSSGSPKTAYEVINTMEKKYNNSLFASSTVRAILSQIATGQKKLDGAVHYALKD